MYNWFRRRVAAYGNLLSKLFQTINVHKRKQADTIITKQPNKRTIHENVVVQNDFDNDLHSDYASRLLTEVNISFLQASLLTMAIMFKMAFRDINI